MRISLIGRGRLGRTLFALLSASPHTVELLGRGALPATPDVVVLCVPDGAIAPLAAQLAIGPVLLHCSGACDLDVLAPHTRIGSLHPLMTFPGPEVGTPDLAGVPAAVSGTPEALADARAIAATLGLDAVEVPGDRRLYHAAAVIAGNFATVLLDAAAEALAAAGVPADQAPAMLAPLALRSLQNAVPSPRAALTGPAARGDHATIAAHREALVQAGLSELLSLYDPLTERAIAMSRRDG